MIRYLIKNNIKLMLRSPMTVLVYVLGPTIIAAILISAFNSLMESYEGVDNFEVGYRIEAESVFEDYLDSIIESFEDNGIRLVEYKEGDPENMIRKHNLAGFVDFGKEDYKIYEIKDSKVEGHILEYSLTEAFEEASDAAFLQAVGMEPIEVSSESETDLNVEHPKFVPAINSADYYGIIEIVYFASFSIVCGAAFFSKEKKNKIARRYQVSNISNFKLYLARIISVTAAVSVSLILAISALIALMGVHWGNPGLSVLIVLLLILGTLAMELMLLALTDSMAATVIITFVIVWLWGFFGGSFETYMFSSHSQTLKELSPIYYANRSLVELSCMGHSDYVANSIIISMAMCAAFSVLAVLISKMRSGRA
ncbi:MAG: ABC transporter permease [Eubacterium sp.]|nr:ABC transporter permease [Eubacterium sp.]